MRSQIFWTFIIALMEITALGIIIPLTPYIARSYLADELQVGLLMGVYSAVQCIMSPLWGKWSDKWGRKPVLILCFAFTALSYIWFAVAPNLSHLFYSRILAGFFSSSFSISFACISDRTEKSSRSKSMALIGAAFGLGFVIGPLIGAGLGQLSFSAIALGSACVCFLGFLFSIFILKESLFSATSSQKLKDPATLKSAGSFFSSFKQVFTNPKLKKVLCLFFITSLALGLVEAPLFLYVQDQFRWPQSLSSVGFAYVGFVLALSKGVFSRVFIPKWGESKICLWGTVWLSLGVFGLCIPHISVLALAVTGLAFGFGMAYMGLTGMISLSAEKSSQGRVLGVHQSLASLTRILGPALGGWMYRDISHLAPFLSAGFLSLFGLFFLLRNLSSKTQALSLHSNPLKTNTALKASKKNMGSLYSKPLPSAVSHVEQRQDAASSANRGSFSKTNVSQTRWSKFFKKLFSKNTSQTLESNKPEMGSILENNDRAMTVFQLEQLLKNQIPFSLFYLVEDPSDLQNTGLSEYIMNRTAEHGEKKNKDNNKEQKSWLFLLNKAQKVTSKELLEMDLHHENPIVLLCEDRKVSQNTAQALSHKCKNIFYIEDPENLPK